MIARVTRDGVVLFYGSSKRYVLPPALKRWFGRRLFVFQDSLPGHLICLTPRTRAFVGFAVHPPTVRDLEISALTYQLLGRLDEGRLLTA